MGEVGQRMAPVGAAEPPGTQALRGALLMLWASACFAGMAALVKLAGTTLPAMVVVFGRALLVASLAGATAMHGGAPLVPHDKRRMVWRCLVGLGSIVCYYLALTKVPLATAVTLKYTSPLFVALFSGAWLGERVGVGVVVAMVGALVGTVLVTSPDLTGIDPWALLALAAAVFSAIAHGYIRLLRRTEAPATIVLDFSVFTAVCAAPWLVSLESVPSWVEVGWLAGVGGLAFVGQLSMTHAFRIAPAALTSAFSYSSVLFGVGLGALFFGELPAPTTLAGAALIVAVGVALSLQARRSDLAAATGAG